MLNWDIRRSGSVNLVSLKIFLFSLEISVPAFVFCLDYGPNICLPAFAVILLKKKLNQPAYQLSHFHLFVNGPCAPSYSISIFHRPSDVRIAGRFSSALQRFAKYIYWVYSIQYQHVLYYYSNTTTNEPPGQH